MEENILINFPYPYKLDNEFFDGLIAAWPDFCKKCSHQDSCQHRDEEYHTCPRGLTFRWHNKSLMIGGVVLIDRTSTPPQVRSALRKINKENVVYKKVIDNALQNISKVENQYSQMCETTINRIVQDKRDSAINSTEIKNTINSCVEEYLKSMHDVKQFISTVTQNINCMMENYKKKNDEENLSVASEYEKAIFYSCKMMEAKIQTLSHVKNAHEISEIDFSQTSIHQLITKIIRIYESSFYKKNIRVTISPCYDKVYTHYKAVTVLPHAIIDNALKYTPDGTTFKIFFSNTEGQVKVDFESLGPQILEHEKTSIFEPAVRGKYAIATSESGMGFGLYAAQVIARKLCCNLFVDQHGEDILHEGYYHTIFTIIFPKENTLPTH